MTRWSLLCVSACAFGSSCSLFFGSADPESLPLDATAPADSAVVVDAGIPSMPFPPTSDVNLVDGIFGDVNGDGIDDLLLATAPTAGADNGVYILLGPQTGPELVFHHFVKTAAAPTSITLGQGGLGISSAGTSTLLVGYREPNAAVDAFVYSDATAAFGPALAETTTSGSDPLAIVIGDFDRNGIAGDVVMAALRGLLKFFRWLPLPDENQPTTATGETLEADIVALGTLSASLDDELVVVLKKPKIIWRYFDEEDSTPLSDGTTFEGACQVLSFASVAQKVNVTDEFIDVVATSDSRLCGYRLQSELGTRSIQESHHPFDNASAHLLPSPAQGFDDIVVVNLNTQAEPEIVLLDTFNTMPTTITLVRDTVALDGVPGVLTMTSITSIDLNPPMSPAFLLAPDFNNDGTSEVWAIDLRARGAVCLQMDGNDLVPCL